MLNAKNLKKFIEVSFQKEGIHRYPAALTDPNLADVSFLGHPHRHIFHFKVVTSVNHADRDIEFIQQKRWMESLCSEGTINIDFKSCEMLAEELIEKLVDKYGETRYYRVSVYEDDENGGIVEYIPEGWK